MSAKQLAKMCKEVVKIVLIHHHVTSVKGQFNLFNLLNSILTKYEEEHIQLTKDSIMKILQKSRNEKFVKKMLQKTAVRLRLIS